MCTRSSRDRLNPRQGNQPCPQHLSVSGSLSVGKGTWGSATGKRNDTGQQEVLSRLGPTLQHMMANTHHWGRLTRGPLLLFLLFARAHKCTWTKVPGSKGTWKKCPQDTVMQSLVLGTRQICQHFAPWGWRGRSPHLSTGPGFQHSPRGRKKCSNLYTLPNGTSTNNQTRIKVLLRFPLSSLQPNMCWHMGPGDYQAQ